MRTRTGECVPVLFHQTSAATVVLIIGAPEIEVWRMTIGDLNAPIPVHWVRVSARLSVKPWDRKCETRSPNPVTH